MDQRVFFGMTKKHRKYETKRERGKKLNNGGIVMYVFSMKNVQETDFIELEKKCLTVFHRDTGERYAGKNALCENECPVCEYLREMAMLEWDMNELMDDMELKDFFPALDLKAIEEIS